MSVLCASFFVSSYINNFHRPSSIKFMTCRTRKYKLTKF